MFSEGGGHRNDKCFISIRLKGNMEIKHTFFQ